MSTIKEGCSKKYLKSQVAYNAYYVDQQSQHLKTRISEHNGKRHQQVCAKFDRCIQGVSTVNNVEELMSASRGVDFLLVLEALYIRELKPKLSSNGQ